MQVNAVFRLRDTGLKTLTSTTDQTQAQPAVLREPSGTLPGKMHSPRSPNDIQITFAVQEQETRKRGTMTGRLVLERCVVSAIIILGLAAVTANARTIYVDDDAPNDPAHGDPTISDPDENGTPEHPFDAIQEGIDAANHFDTVLVADGTYTGDGNKNLDFGGKPIALRSANGHDSCFIDCEDAGRGFYFRRGESPACVVDGFTIQNGHVDQASPGGADGGAILCEASDPTIINCTIKSSWALGRGGGVCLRNFAFPSIRDCTITGNWAQQGAGISCTSQADATIANCRIEGNTAGGMAGTGGGIYCAGSNPTITGCLVKGNSATSGNAGFASGGGVSTSGGSPTISDCRIIENWVASGYLHPAYGGGIYCVGGTPSIHNCTIEGNIATNAPNHGARGGGVYCGGNGEMTIANSTIADNEADTGGGVSCEDSVVVIANSTMTINSAYSVGGALHSRMNGEASISGSILWANSAPEGTELAVGVGSMLAVAYSDVRLSEEWVYAKDGSTLDWQSTNIDANPMFVSAQYGNYRLLPDSPCIDASDNTAVPLDIADLDGDGDTGERTPFDLDHTARFVDDCQTPDTGNPYPPEYVDIVDMGAYEHDRVDADGDGTVDLMDFADFQVCFTGDVPGLADGCERFDSDCDDDVDLVDFSALLSATTGPR